MAMIDIKDLKKSFGTNHVLNGVKLSVDKGDMSNMTLSENLWMKLGLQEKR